MSRWLPWIFSGSFHAGLLWLLFRTMPAWHLPPAGFPDEPLRDIEIVFQARGTAIENSEPVLVEVVEAPPPSADPPADDPFTPQRPVPDLPTLPKVERQPVVRPVKSIPVEPPARPKVASRSSAVSARPASQSRGKPGAAFLGAQDEGLRIAYVVDASESMHRDQAMRLAKEALTASVQDLDAAQRFQIIFYNETPLAMNLKSNGRASFYPASDFYKRNAATFVKQIQPELGTQHFDAIQLALSLGPDVLFLLTDSGNPQLTPGELDQIQRTNRGRTHIHCVEFGVGPDLTDAANFLKQLASRNAGMHRYVDLRQHSAGQNDSSSERKPSGP